MSRKKKKKPYKFTGVVTCPYCRNHAVKVTGQVIYPHRKDLWRKIYFLCPECEAYVGTHKATGEPMGRLANKELRVAKMDAHAAFDPMWRDGSMKRTEAYRWLAERLGIDFSVCHIGMFDVAMCRNVVAVCEKVKA